MQFQDKDASGSFLKKRTKKLLLLLPCSRPGSLGRARLPQYAKVRVVLFKKEPLPSSGLPQHLIEIRNCAQQPIFQMHNRLPSQRLSRQRDVRAALKRVVNR